MSGMNKTQLLGMTPDELTVYFKQLGQPAFRARQVFAWLHQGADFEQMSNLPKALRETLDENCVANPVSVLETIESKLDGTIKLLYRLPDGNWYPQGEQPENDLLNDYHNAEYAQIFDAKNRSDEWYTP